MNNEMHGLCSKCIEHFNHQRPTSISYTCQKCNQNQSQFISNDLVICIKCYNKQGQSVSVLKKASELKMSNLLTLVPKGQMGSSMTSFLSRNGKVIKKIQKILTTYDLKSNQLAQQLQKKSILSSKSQITWQKITEKCHKTSSLIYFFVGKDLIFGAFHTEPIKITSQNSFVQDSESGLFLTERSKYYLNIYKTSKNMVKYSQKTKSITLGDPIAFQITFSGKLISIKSQIQQQLKWDGLFVYKV